MNPKNFRSVTEAGMSFTTHQVYQDLAADAVLLSVNDRLPTMTDEEKNALVDAAQLAAKTVLELACVPCDWLSLLESLHRTRTDKVRDQLHDYIFDLLPPKDPEITEQQLEALARVRACVAPKKFTDLESAMHELELAYAIEAINVIPPAFALGYQIAHDPTRILFSKDGE